jgi:gas vesicle protein
MFRHTKTAFKFFVYGLAVGLLFAPRSGAESRKELVNWLTGTVKEAIGGATGSTNS